MKITLAIPAFNEEKFIGPCIRSALDIAPENLEEILVINNASTDKTAEVAASFAKVRVVNEPKKGLTKARQRALTEAKGELLAFVDADSLLPKNWFKVLNREFLKDPELVCLSGPYVYYDSSRLSQWCVRWLYWGMLAKVIYFFTKYMATGGNFVAKKSALEKIGGFDTSIVFYGEDTDIARRLHEVGKVKFENDFFMRTSARRFAKEGVWQTGWRYVANYTSIMFFKKPVSKAYKDIR